MEYNEPQLAELLPVAPIDALESDDEASDKNSEEGRGGKPLQL